MQERSCKLPRDLWVLVASRAGCEDFANFADKSQACLVRLTGSEGDLSRRLNCYVSYAGI
jgi:hypothetical protein